MKFKIGDRVEVPHPMEEVSVEGFIKEVVKSGMYGVELSVFNKNLHSISGNGKDGHGWYYPERLLKLAPELENE